MCPGCPAHLKNVQLRCKCSVRLSGAESTKQAIKWACIRLRGGPHKAPFKLQRLHKLALPCLKDAVQLPKGLFFFCFKYQNYKNQFINCFPKTTTKTKQSPESKQNKILSKVLITLLLKLKPSAHSHVTGKRKGACSTWWPHGQKVPKSSNGLLFENHRVGNSCSDIPRLFLDQGEIFQIELEELSEF